MVLGRASTISPSISIFSSLGTAVRLGPGLDEADVHRLRTLVADLFLVLDLGVLGEALEALAVDARVVHEEVAIALVRSDEAVALLVVEPLDGSRRHVSPFLRVPARSVIRIRPRHLRVVPAPFLFRRPSWRNASKPGGVNALRTSRGPDPPPGRSGRP